MSCLRLFSAGLSPGEGRQGASIPSQYLALFFGGEVGCLCAHRVMLMAPHAPDTKEINWLDPSPWLRF